MSRVARTVHLNSEQGRYYLQVVEATGTYMDNHFSFDLTEEQVNLLCKQSTDIVLTTKPGHKL